MSKNNYWTNAEDNKKKAVKHTAEMKKKYAKEIADATYATKVYGYPCYVDDDTQVKEMSIEVNGLDSVSAIMAERLPFTDIKMAVLNFASYTAPGGKFIEGSMAQEEALCHESFLYNVLATFHDSYYAKNNKDKNKGMYRSVGLYTPNVVFERDGDVARCDVITCAAPNYSVALKYKMYSREENYEALKERIQFVLTMAKANKVNVLILGAFGCGVFKQDPVIVARIFKELLSTDEFKCFERVVFAVKENSNSNNLRAFREVFSK